MRHKLSAHALKMAAVFAGRSSRERLYLNAVRVEVTARATTLIATDGNAMIVHQTPNALLLASDATFSIPIAIALSLTKDKIQKGFIYVSLPDHVTPDYRANNGAMVMGFDSSVVDLARYPDWRDVFSRYVRIRENQTTRFLPFINAEKLNKACVLANRPYSTPAMIQEGDSATIYTITPGAIVVLAMTVGEEPNRRPEDYAFAMPLEYGNQPAAPEPAAPAPEPTPQPETVFFI